MSQKRKDIDREAVGAEFGDILDRMPGRSAKSTPRAPQRRQQSPQTSPTPRRQQARDESKPIKVSLYLAPEDINALDEIIMQRRLEEGVSPRRTHLIREAIHQWLAVQES